jgi:hypothetical protein
MFRVNPLVFRLKTYLSTITIINTTSKLSTEELIIFIQCQAFKLHGLNKGCFNLDKLFARLDATSTRCTADQIPNCSSAFYGAPGVNTATFVQTEWQAQNFPDFLFLW